MQKEEMKSGHFVPEFSALVPSASTSCTWPAISKNSKLNVEVLATASSIKLVGDAWELHAPTYVFFSWAPVHTDMVASGSPVKIPVFLVHPLLIAQDIVISPCY